MQSCIYLFQSQAESKRIQITISVPHDIPEIIYSDRARVKQIILNLLSNSIKYTPANGRIILRALFKDPSIEISIIDTGLGIDLKIQSSLFKLFGRVESKSMGSTGIDSGSRAGLGLTISHAIALMLGNGITFSSKENKGSVFKFEIKHLDMSHSMRKSNALAKDGEGFNSNENLFSSFILPKLERNNSGVLEEVENIRKMQFENQIHQVFQKQNSQERIEVLHVVENEEQDFEIVEAEEAKENTSDVEEGLVNEKQLLGYKKKNISLVYNSPIKLSPFIKSKSMSIIIPANSLKECKCAPIIIVDDLSFNLMVLEGFLKKMGLAAARAYNGKEAYELIDSYSKCKCETLKGVLTDIEMPVMNGFEFAKEARAMMKSGKWKTVPIMAVTAYSDEGTREKCVDVGISECLSKPVVIADLRNILRKYDII
jgi:CheY-like chemotaxis protein